MMNDTPDISTPPFGTRQAVPGLPADSPLAVPSLARSVRRWLLLDSPYILMLALALIGVTLREPVSYWLVMTPVFGVICIVAGWRHFTTRQEKLELVYTQALSWGALILAVWVLYDNGAQGVMNSNASALAMLTLLALGTFTAGVQARVWRTCAVGAVMFLIVPAIGWLDQSSMLLIALMVIVIALGGVTWWVRERRGQPT